MLQPLADTGAGGYSDTSSAQVAPAPARRSPAQPTPTAQPYPSQQPASSPPPSPAPIAGPTGYGSGSQPTDLGSGGMLSPYSGIDMYGQVGSSVTPPPPQFTPDSGGHASISAGLPSTPTPSPLDLGFTPYQQHGDMGSAPLPPMPTAQTGGQTSMSQLAGAPAGAINPNIGVGSIAAPSPVSALTPAAGGAPVPAATAAPAGPTSTGFGTLSQFGPGSDLTSTEISPQGAPDRMSIAQNYLNTYKGQLLPQLQAQTRDAVRNNAALGRLGSGMLNTNLGNLDLAAENSYNTMAGNLLNNAEEGTIGDQLNQRNELRAERGYQTGQQNTAFNQGMAGTELQDQLTGNAFERALQEEGMGQSGNPASTDLALSSIFGGMGSQAGNSLGGMINSTTMNNAIQSGQIDPAMLQQYLMQMFGGGRNLTGGNTPDAPGAGIDLSGLGQIFGGGGPGQVPTVPQVQTPSIPEDYSDLYGGMTG